MQSFIQHLLCLQSDEILFCHFMTALNVAFESKLVLEDEGFQSSGKTSTYQLHSEELPRSTTFLVLRMPLLIQIHLHHIAQAPESHITDLYNVI